MYVYCQNKSTKNAFVPKLYFAAYVTYSSSIKIEIFYKVT